MERPAGRDNGEARSVAGGLFLLFYYYSISFDDERQNIQSQSRVLFRTSSQKTTRIFNLRAGFFFEQVLKRPPGYLLYRIYQT